MEDHPKPFVEHLEELRSRLIKSLAAIAVCTVIFYQLVDQVLLFLARPVGRFIFLQPMEAFFVRMKIAFCGGVLIAMPVLLYQAWRFIVIALTPLEKKSLFWVLPISFLLFLGGSTFAFFVLVPAGVRILLSYGSSVLVPQISIDTYVNFVGILCLVLGGVFQMPLASFFLAKFGILGHQLLSEKRKVACLIVYILSALLTPGPDPVTAVLLAVPTYLLFECSILTAWLARS